MLNGIIIVKKESGFTSNDVVAKMRGICKQKKIGHTGTLDPDATGVLPLCLGTGTKLCDMLTERDKEYVTELLLGVTTDTQDVTGTVLSEHAVEATEEEVRSAVMSFVGKYDQVPPMYSALKVGGKKLYELAREGKEVERKARRVEILEIEIMEIKLPVVKMRVHCSKGTYIRTLCADAGDKLGCGGTMKSLVRTKVGRYELSQAHTLSELEAIRDGAGLESVLIPTESAFMEHRRLRVMPEAEKMLRNGNAIPWALIGREDAKERIEADGILTADEGKRPAEPKGGELIRACTVDGTFLGLYEYFDGEKKIRPIKMFL